MVALPSSGSWSLKTKFAVCSGLLMFCFSVTSTTWMLHMVDVEVRARVTETQRMLVESTRRDLDEKVGQRRDALTVVAKLLSQVAPESPPEMTAFFAPRPVLRKLFDAVLVVDGTGHIVHEVAIEPARIGASVAGYAFFAKTLAGSEMVISQVVASPETGESFVAFAAPLHAHETTAATGALIGILNLTRSNFVGALGKQRIGRDGYYALIDRREPATFVMHADPLRIMTAAPGGLSAPLMIQALRGEDGSQTATNYKGIETVRTFAPLREGPWVLIALYPTTEAFAGLHARQREILWIGVVLFLLGWGGAYCMSSWLLRPLAMLKELMERHAADPGLQMPTTTFGSSELAGLVAAYNAQAASRSEFEGRLKASEQQMKDVTDNMPALVAYIDRDQVYRFANARYRDWLGVDPVSMIGRPACDVLRPAQYEATRPKLEAAMRGERTRWDGWGMRDGRRIEFKVDYIPDIAPDGSTRGCYALTVDVTAEKEAQAAQLLVEERLRAITDNLPVLISYRDASERYLFLNATFKSWLGIDPKESIGRRFADVIGTAAYDLRAGYIRRCLAGERLTFEIESKTLLGSKSLQVTYLPDCGPDGTVRGWYTISNDVSELKEAQRQLALLARADALTGLANRYRFNEVLPLAIARCARSGTALGLMFLDIDHFKRINDSLGHAAGDQSLKEFGQRLSGSVRSTDTVARLGGDEFVVILEGLKSEAGLHVLARKFLDAISRPFELAGQTLTVTTSIGIAYSAHADVTASAVLACADAALYRAKAEGRDRYSLSCLEEKVTRAHATAES